MTRVASPNDLLRRLADPSPEARLQAVLEASDPNESPADDEVVQTVIARLDDDHPGVQQAALESLSRLIEAGRASVGTAALERALALATHRSARVRAEAVGALGVFCPQVDSAERRQQLQAALTDEDPEVRRAAAAACGDLHLDEARSLLVSALSDAETEFEAAFALATLGDRRARPALEAALAARATRLDALEALRRLGDADAKPSVRAIADAWLSAWADRLSALATLHVLGDPDAAAGLVDRARSRRMEERVYALFLLGRNRIPEGRSIIDQIAADRAHRERETALDALAGYGDARAVATLRAVANNADELDDIRRAAAYALERIAPPADVEEQ